MGSVFVRIFISYSREDRAVVARLCEALASAGISFFADTKIRTGENFHRRIDDEIGRSSHVICLVSSASNRSAWVTKERNIAEAKGVPVVPVLIERGVPLTPVYDEKINYMQMYERDVSDEEIYERLIKADVFKDGLLPAGLFWNRNCRFPHEVFAAELLTQPIFMKWDDGKLQIHINRADVDHVVVSNGGKRKLCETFVKPNRAKLIDLDRQIFTFMRGASESPVFSVPTRDLPLRWASGGVLSVVKHEGKVWVPLFFRDIPPYGWNISLGATERSFDDSGFERKNAEFSASRELMFPWKFIVREFLEETLVLRNEQLQVGICEWRRFDFMQHIQIKMERDQAELFAHAHLKLRRNQDGLQIQKDPKGIRVSICRELNTDLSILDADPTSESEPFWGVLVTINPLELGIEVIKVFEYTLPENHCILDGEVYVGGGRSDIVRMPVALLSMDYLFRNFGAADYQLAYDDKEIQPSVVAQPFAKGDIKVFPWDVQQRREIWGAGSASDWQRKRYSDWKKLFEESFERGSGDEAAFPALFTPATVKALNLFFIGSARGRRLAAQMVERGIEPRS